MVHDFGSAASDHLLADRFTARPMEMKTSGLSRNETGPLVCRVAATAAA